jgi:hypothetical protein
MPPFGVRVRASLCMSVVIEAAMFGHALSSMNFIEAIDRIRCIDRSHSSSLRECSVLPAARARTFFDGGVDQISLADFLMHTFVSRPSGANEKRPADHRSKDRSRGRRTNDRGAVADPRITIACNRISNFLTQLR